MEGCISRRLTSSKAPSSGLSVFIILGHIYCVHQIVDSRKRFNLYQSWERPLLLNWNEKAHLGLLQRRR